MASGDLYVLIDKQIYVTADDNPAFNVYAFRQTSGSGAALDLANAFRGAILPLVVGVQSVAVGHYEIEVLNLDQPSDFVTSPVSSEDGTGTQTGDCLPRYNAFSFKYARATRASRNGWKRVMGVPESVQVNGDVTNSGELTALDALAAGMAAGLVDGGGNSWSPRIYRREVVVDDVVTVERADFGISGVSYTGLTTQNTRKR